MRSLLFTTALTLGLAASGALASEDTWYKDAIQVTADGQPLDTGDGRPSLDGLWFDRELAGHAAPVYYDWDKDGRRDLLVGGFSGRFRVYLNQGADDAPAFGGYNWIRANGEIAQLYNHCCVATGIRMADIDGDGMDDLTAGHYSPGYLYSFQGREDGFTHRVILTDYADVPILTGLDTIADPRSVTDSLAARPAWMDWNDDGRLDLIIGNRNGDLTMRLNIAVPPQPGQRPLGQPGFSQFESFGGGEFSVFDHVDGGAGLLAEENFLSPVAADWDGDGLTDLVIGAGSGAVYWLRNIGEAGEPSFAAPQMLLPGLPGKAYPPYQVLADDQTPPRGARASVDVADWNGDGKMDLIVGGYVASLRLRDDLTTKELQEFEAVKQRLVDLDRRTGVEGPPEPFRARVSSTPVYVDSGFNSDLWNEMKALEAEAAAYMEPWRDFEFDLAKFGNHVPLGIYARSHGHIWVYLRK